MPNRLRLASRWAATLALAIVAFALPREGRAAPESQLALSYSIDAGGMTVLRIHYEAALAPDTYRSSASIKTKGLAGLFSSYKMDMSASGTVSADTAKPARFASHAEKKDKERAIELRWQGGNPPEVKTTPPDPEDEALIAGALTPSLVDPLSMVLRMTAFQADAPCGKTIAVVDGREVYELRFALQGKAKIGPDMPGAYRGPAFKCNLSYVPVAGRAARKFKKAGTAPSRFDIWFAPVSAATAAQTWYVPVLATGKLKGLRFTAYASVATLDGNAIAANED
ncbi:MAG: DUF3108 domain-containing protein [Parvibaculaceae bacterium]